jgi:hypothetical protein
MRSYAGQNEVRFKVTDRDKELYRETAWYLYENHLISPPVMAQMADNASTGNLTGGNMTGGNMTGSISGYEEDAECSKSPACIT